MPTVYNYVHVHVRVCVHVCWNALCAQVLPGTMRGTVLGFSARAPDNSSAIEVSFGCPSYATALARVFQWVS